MYSVLIKFEGKENYHSINKILWSKYGQPTEVSEDKVKHYIDGIWDGKYLFIISHLSENTEEGFVNYIFTEIADEKQGGKDL